MEKGQALKVGDKVEGKTILKVKDGREPHLQVVMAQWRDEYVTWLYNKSCPGFSHGHYHGYDFANAEYDYHKRT